MALEVLDDTFYMVQHSGEQTIHQTEDEAINHLREQADDVDPENEEVSVVRISVDGEDWTIAEMSWQNIALQLMAEQ